MYKLYRITPCLGLLVSSVDNIGKQFGTRSGPILFILFFLGWGWAGREGCSGSKLFDSYGIPKCIFGNVNFDKKSANGKKACKIN